VYKRFEMHVKDAIGIEENVRLQANWRHRRSRYKRIQLHRTDLQDVSGPIQIKNKRFCFQRKLFIVRASCYFQGKYLVHFFQAPHFRLRTAIQQHWLLI